MNSKFIPEHDSAMEPHNLGPWLMKSSQSNFNLRSPSSYLVRSYLITTVQLMMLAGGLGDPEFGSSVNHIPTGGEGQIMPTF